MCSVKPDMNFSPATIRAYECLFCQLTVPWLELSPNCPPSAPRYLFSYSVATVHHGMYHYHHHIHGLDPFFIPPPDDPPSCLALFLGLPIPTYVSISQMTAVPDSDYQQSHTYLFRSGSQRSRIHSLLVSQ